MINRILQIMKEENISASKFADIIGVQRSSISHILSERNKPSLELIQKILIAYPNVNAEWLLTGKSKINNTQTLQNENFRIENSIKNEEIENKNNQEFGLFTNVINKNSHYSTNKNTSKVTSVNNLQEQQNKQEYKKELNDIQSTKQKTIERIVLFYSDNTFIEYTPS